MPVIDKKSDLNQFFQKEFTNSPETADLNSYKDFLSKYGPNGTDRIEVTRDLVKESKQLEEKINILKDKLPQNLREVFEKSIQINADIADPNARAQIRITGSGLNNRHND